MAAAVRPYLRPLTAAGLGGSVLLAAVLGLAGAASGVEALLVALAGATLTLVADASARAERRFRLRDLLQTTDWLFGAVVSIATATRQIAEQHPAPEVLAEARRRLQAVTDGFEELARGRIVRPATDYDLLVAGTRACHRRMQAVTVVPPGPGGARWWDGEAGRRYWQANLDALSRGVAITRVFVCAEVDPALTALVEAQRAAGVETLVAPRAALGAVAAGPEFVLWEGRRGWEARAGAGGEVVGHVFTVDERDVARLLGAFDACAGAARPVGD